MEDGERLESVRVFDNGVRSFVPPCFCFEILSKHGEKIGIVSKLEIVEVDLAEKDVTNGRIYVSGFIRSYSVEETEYRAEEGLCFVVTRRG